MTNTYTTKDGDMLDAICYNHYGFTDGAVETVYSEPRNKHLAEYTFLPAGLTIYLPPVSQETKATASKALW